MRKVLFYLLIFFIKVSFAQQTEETTYKREITLGLNLNTQASILGGITLKYSQFKKENSMNTFFLEIVNIKHPKEIRVQSSDTVKYIYGKQNFLFNIRTMAGKEIVVFHKAKNEGVQLNAIFAGGIAWGLLKPYMVLYGKSKETSKLQPFRADMLGSNGDQIWGTGTMFDGMDKTVLLPGLSGRASSNLEFSAFSKTITGVEVGFQADWFLYNNGFNKEVILIPNVKNKSLFLSLFATIYFGYRK